MSAEDQVHGMTGKQNAKKDESEKASSFLHVRVTSEEKARFVAQAQKEGMKLAEWVKLRLGEASEGAFD